VHPEPEVHDAQQALALRIPRLQRERSFELGLGLVDRVLREQLAAAVEVIEELLVVVTGGGRRIRVGSRGSAGAKARSHRSWDGESEWLSRSGNENERLSRAPLWSTARRGCVGRAGRRPGAPWRAP